MVPAISDKHDLDRSGRVTRGRTFANFLPAGLSTVADGRYGEKYNFICHQPDRESFRRLRQETTGTPKVQGQRFAKAVYRISQAKGSTRWHSLESRISSLVRTDGAPSLRSRTGFTQGEIALRFWFFESPTQPDFT